jgi:hypothetical protein
LDRRKPPARGPALQPSHSALGARCKARKAAPGPACCSVQPWGIAPCTYATLVTADGRPVSVRLPDDLHDPLAAEDRMRFASD